MHKNKKDCWGKCGNLIEIQTFNGKKKKNKKKYGYLGLISISLNIGKAKKSEEGK